MKTTKGANKKQPTEQRESFVFYRSFKDAMEVLNDTDKLIVYEAIADYALNMQEPHLSGFPRSLFTLIKPQLDANWRRYENGKRGAEHGAKGGAPIGNANASKGNRTIPKQPQNNPKTTPNDNVNVNDNVNDDVNDKSKPVKSDQKKFNFKNAMLDFGFDEKLVDEWISVRKLKKARNSELAFNNFIDEVKKTGKDINEVLSIVASKQWRGFEASWLQTEKHNYKHPANDILGDGLAKDQILKF